MPPSAANENFSGQQPQYGATNATYNAPQAGFQPPSNNPFARETEFNQSNQYSSQNNYQQNYQQQNYQQQNYQPHYNPNNPYQNNPYQNAGVKIKLAVISLVFGILGLPPLSFFGMGLLAAILGSIFGGAAAVLGILIPLALIPTSLICGIVALRRASKAPQEYGGKGMAIAGIVLSGLTILVVPIVAAIAVPNLFAARQAANESAALTSIRTLTSAELTYQATSGAGNFGDLQALANAGLIDNVLATGEKSGYRFTVTVRPATLDTPAYFEISAKPSVTQGMSSTGSRSFYTSDGEIHWAKNGDKPADENSPVLEDSRQSNVPKSAQYRGY